MEFHQFIRENYPRFGIEQNDIGELEILIKPYNSGIANISKDEISMLFPIGDYELVIKRDYKGNEKILLQRRIMLEEIGLKGVIVWDGEGFLSLDSNSFIPNLKPNLPYDAIFDFNLNEVIIVKELNKGADLEKEINEFKIDEYLKFISKTFYNRSE